MGHVFGLLHTFAGIEPLEARALQLPSKASICAQGCAGGGDLGVAGDFCADTPPMPQQGICAVRDDARTCAYDALFATGPSAVLGQQRAADVQRLQWQDVGSRRLLERDVVLRRHVRRQSRRRR
jgi:hypothetical protein